MAALTDWVLSHKRLVLGLWLVVWIAAVAALGPAGSSLSQQFNVPGTRGLRDEQGARRDLRRRRRRRADRARGDAPAGEDGRFARRPRGAWCGAGEGGGGAAGVDERLLCLDRRPGVRLRRRPHHLRARLHPGQGWSRPRAGGGPRGAGRAGGRHRRRIRGRGDGARRAPRLRRGQRGRRRRRRAGDARGGAGRAARPRLRLPLVHGFRAAVDGAGRDPDDVPAGLAARERDRRLGDRPVPRRA